MANFSIESLSERISNSNSKEYFKEVTRSYYNGCYRSSIVMLWTVVVCDMVFKLQTLSDYYSDDRARNTLKELKNGQEKNEKDTSWEKKLLEDMKTEFQLLENNEFLELEHLQKQRHLSAHPVLSNDHVLYSPSKETAHAAIRNALEFILIKPAVLTKQNLIHMLQDISNSQNIFTSEEDMKIFLEDRYLKRMTDITVKESFKLLWKFCFKIENENTEYNRSINIKVLNIIFKRSPNENCNLISSDNLYYSDILDNDETLKILCKFIIDNSELLDKLDETTQLKIKKVIKNDINLKIQAYFLEESFIIHLKNLKESGLKDGSDNENGFFKDASGECFEFRNIKGESFETLLKQAKEQGMFQEYVKTAVDLFAQSTNYNRTDFTFEFLIAPIINEFDVETMTRLLDGSNENNQIFHLSDKLYFKQVFTKAHELKIDILTFQNLAKSAKST